MLKRTRIFVYVTLLAVIGLTSCSVFRSSASKTISINELNLGMNKETVLDIIGQPFSFSMRVSDNDTITVLSYKTPRHVANCEYIITTDLSFINDKLESISQRDFYVPDNVMFCDSTKIAR